MLRVFLSAPPSADHAESWVRYAAGRPQTRGRDVPSRWPADPDVEVVLAADRVRLAALHLPPMPRNRLRQAARYALEDQMATPASESAVAVASSDGSAIAAIASDALLRAIRGHDSRIARIIPESALAPRGDGWTWCASAAGGGFVRRADGSAFAVGRADGGELPAELQAALAQAARAGTAPAIVHAAVPADPTQLARWSQAAGMKFAAAPEWHWEEAATATFAAAPDFLANDASANGAPATARTAGLFRPALMLALLALTVHAGGLLVEWAWLHLVDWRLSRALVREATSAGVQNVTSAAAAASAIARKNADLRHRAGKDAPGDPLPLLARAAPAVGALPSGTLKSATYADDAWTLELAKVDADTLSRVARALTHAGVDAVSAPTAGGTRMRLSLSATALAAR